MLYHRQFWPFVWINYSLFLRKSLTCLLNLASVDDWNNALVQQQFTSKITEKSVAIQMQDHMVANSLFPDLQSTYRPNYSTETGLLKVKNDLLLNMDKGHVTSLVVLDLSAAFDTVEHGILRHRLQSKLGLRGKALLWFKSYLVRRTRQIYINRTLSEKLVLSCGVPQSS